MRSLSSGFFEPVDNLVLCTFSESRDRIAHDQVSCSLGQMETFPCICLAVCICFHCLGIALSASTACQALNLARHDLNAPHAAGGLALSSLCRQAPSSDPSAMPSRSLWCTRGSDISSKRSRCDTAAVYKGGPALQPHCYVNILLYPACCSPELMHVRYTGGHVLCTPATRPEQPEWRRQQSSPTIPGLR